MPLKDIYTHKSFRLSFDVAFCYQKSLCSNNNCSTKKKNINALASKYVIKSKEFHPNIGETLSKPLWAFVFCSSLKLLILHFYASISPLLWEIHKVHRAL